MAKEGYVLQGGAAGRADAGEAQDDAAQVQAPMAAAAVKQDASTATDMATCASARDELADNPTPVNQDKHTGDCLIRTVPSQCSSGLPYNLLLACSLAPCLCRVGQRCTLNLLTVIGAAQQGSLAVRHRLEALPTAGLVAQSAKRRLRRQRRCAILGSPLAPFVSPRALQWLLMCKHCPMTCIEGDASDIMHCSRMSCSAYSRRHGRRESALKGASHYVVSGLNLMQAVPMAGCLS